MIITAKKRIPFLWMFLALLPWVAVIFKDKVMSAAFVLSMRKWVENPAALTFLLAIPSMISWIVPPTVNFMADRIWTRWGRRKPFIVTAWLGTIVCMFCMAIAPDFAWLLFAYVGFAVFNDLAGPVESLKMEIVPPAQRTTSAAVMAWVGNIATLTFFYVGLGRFHEFTTIFGFMISGEQSLFWLACIGVFVMLLFVMLGIKETNPHSKVLGERLTFRNIFRGLFNQQLWPIFILTFSVAILGTGLGAFTALLQYEQWGYTQQDIGTNIMVGGVINMFLIPALGLLAAKMGRSKVYVGLVITAIVLNVSMYLYYNFVLYDGRPTLIEMIVFGEMMSVCGVLTGMALTPLVYDFIPRNELGTYAAGAGLVSRGTGLLTVLLMGLFVEIYARSFLGPAGEMTKVVLASDSKQSEVQSLLSRAKWNDPGSGKEMGRPSMTSDAWYATRARLDHGRCFEIRLKDEDSEKIRKERDRLEEERNKSKARKAYAINRLRKMKEFVPEATTRPWVASTQPAEPIVNVGKLADETLEAATKANRARLAKGPTTNTARDEKVRKITTEAEAERAAEDMLSAAIDRMDGILEQRAKEFRAQVEKRLGERLLKDGEQVIGAGVEPVVVTVFGLESRPEASVVEHTLDRLRKADSSVVDLRVVPDGEKLALAMSTRAAPRTPGATPAEVTLKKSADEVLQKLILGRTPTTRSATALRLDLRIVEDPLDRHPSPISRVVNNIVSVFSDPPTPERRLNALGRGLRRPGTFDHASATVVPGEENAVRLMAVVSQQAATTRPQTEVKAEKAPEAVSKRIEALIGAEMKAPAELLYGVAIPAAKEQRMTVATPIVASGYAKQQYDYLAGYIAIFVLQMVGLGITLFFLSLVRRGKIRRRGAEEAEAVK